MYGFDFSLCIKFLECRIQLISVMMDLRSIITHLQSSQVNLSNFLNFFLHICKLTHYFEKFYWIDFRHFISKIDLKCRALFCIILHCRDALLYSLNLAINIHNARITFGRRLWIIRFCKGEILLYCSKWHLSVKVTRHPTDCWRIKTTKFLKNPHHGYIKTTS